MIRDRRDFEDQPDLSAKEDHGEILVHLDSKDSLDPVATRERQAPSDYLEKPDNRVARDRSDPEDHRVIPDRRVTSDHREMSDLKDHRDCLEIKVVLDSRAHLDKVASQVD